MIKIGKIATTESIVHKEYEVIEVEGRMFAGKDAFLFPDNVHDLRAMECLLIPNEWQWTERIVVKDPDYGKNRDKDMKGKYTLVKGPEALAAIEDMLSRHDTGCLCLYDGTYPYAIPLNHAYKDGKLYMHCGKKGKKLVLIANNPNACYTVYGRREATPANVRSCHLPYDSIIFTGKVRVATDPEEKEAGVLEITEQYGTPYQHGFADMIEVLVFDIESVTARDGRFKPAKERKLYFHKP